MNTQETIERLRSAANKLEEIQDVFSNLSWYLHRHENRIHNRNLAVVEGKGSIIYRLEVDRQGISHATNLGNYKDRIWATVNHDELPPIKVMEIYSAFFSHHRDEVCEILRMLPWPLRYKAYRIIAAHRRKAKREKREKLAHLRQQLAHLRQQIEDLEEVT